MPNFVHLHLHSHYSLLDGLSKIDDIVKRIKENNMTAVALTDHGSVYGAIEFYKKCKKAGIKPILGVEAYIAPYGRLNKRAKIDEKRYHQILLAKNNQGWKNICKLVTAGHLEGFYYKPRIDKEILTELHEGIICLSGCFSGELARALKENHLEEADSIVAWYKNLFGEDYYLEIQEHNPELHELIFMLGKKHNLKIVATQDTHYPTLEDKTAHEVLLAVQTNNKLDAQDRLSTRKYNLSITTPEEMLEKFKDHPEVLENTFEVAEKCSIELTLGKAQIPRYPLPEGETSEEEYLYKLIQQRLFKRFPEPSKAVLDRLEMEFSVIKKTGFLGYFLIVQDFVNWAKDHGIVVGPGRGSAAGSLISYILNVTNLDPLKYDLLFERFLNPDRIQVPDIDIDFTDVRRDEVLAYVRERYGADHVAQIITFGTMAAKAAIRDAGRALGLAYGFCDTLAKMIPFNADIKDTFEQVPEFKAMYERDEDAKRLIDAAKKLEGVARHASVHACGVVISPEPLTNFMAVQKAPQGEETIITQFEMHAVEDLGLLKMDFLGLKNLTIIEWALRLIRENHGIDLKIDDIRLDDDSVFAIFRSGETTGVFQFESTGMRRYLKELKPTELEDIIAMVALYRPGPMDLIPSYIARKHGKEKVEYLHDMLAPILGNTYGIGVYQEQMMRIARDLAGFTLAEADTLRKAIGKKIKELLDEQKDKLINGMVKNNIPEKTAKEIWELFPPFARYGFNRSHAACYAYISYQTAYLKAHYPVEYMTALLNVSGSEVERTSFLIQESNHMGIEVQAPDVNSSFQTFTVDGKNIRFGLSAIKNVGANIVDVIIDDRNKNGPFASLPDFLSRIKHRDMNKKSLESLLKAGALDSFGIKRSKLFGNLDELLRFNQAAKKIAEVSQSSLFSSAISLEALRLKDTPEVDKLTLLSWEKELLGLYLSAHPFELFYPKVEKYITLIKDAKLMPRKGLKSKPFRIAGIVTSIKKIMTKTNQPMFFVTLEDNTDSLEILVFADTIKQNIEIWKEQNPLIMVGAFSYKNGDTKYICDQAKQIPI